VLSSLYFLGKPKVTHRYAITTFFDMGLGVQVLFLAGGVSGASTHTKT